MNLGKVIKTLGKVNYYLPNYFGVVFDKESIDSFFSNTISHIIPKADSEQLWAAKSIYKLLEGRTGNPENVTGTICTVIEKIPQILNGSEPSLWDGTKSSAIMKCIGVSPSNKKDKGKRYLKVYLFCLAGPPAGLRFTIELSENYLIYMLCKKLGLSAKTYTCDAGDITGCLFKCFVKETEKKIALDNIDATQKMKEMNKKLINSRLSLYKCKTPNIACTACKKTRKQCALAVWKG